MTELSGKTVLVTGAIGGIGKSVVAKLETLGAQILAVDMVPEEEAKTIFREAGLSKIHYFRADLTSSQDLARLITWASEFPLDSLVALAGIVVSGDLVNQTDEDIGRVIQTNLTSQLSLSKLCIQKWLSEGVAGQIIFVSSWVDHVPWPGITPYAASKAGLVAACRGIAREYATKGIRANLIAPGIVDVGMAAKQWREEPSYRARAGRAIPLGRLQKPEEVALGIAFLLSDSASYMTGSTLLMDGGASLYPLDPEEKI